MSFCFVCAPELAVAQPCPSLPISVHDLPYLLAVPWCFSAGCAGSSVAAQPRHVCAMCDQRHVGLLARDTSVTTARHTAALGTEGKCHRLCVLRCLVPVPVPRSRAQRDTGDPFFWRDCTAACRPESVSSLCKALEGQEGCDLCPDSSASQLSTSC